MSRFGWFKVFLVLIVGVVTYLVLLPMVLLIIGSFTPGRPGDYSSFTLNNYIQAYYDPKMPELFFNSFVFAIGSTLLGGSIAVTFAWLIERTNTPLRNLAYALVISTIAIPGMLLSIAWIYLLSPNIGFFNQLLVKIFGLKQAPFNIYSLSGMIFVEGLRLVPTTFLLMVGAFRNMDPSLEEAASVAGVNTFTITRRITLRILRPAILVAVIYIFITAIEAFEIPGILGIHNRIFVFSTRVYFVSLGGFATDYGVGNALSMTYLIFSIFLIWLYQKMTRQAERFATITGKAYRPRLIDLGKWKYPSLCFFITYFLFAVIFPIFILVWGSLLPFYQVPSAEAFPFLSMKIYRRIFSSYEVQAATKNTLILVGESVFIITALATIISWVIVRSKFIGRKFLDIITFLPHAIPSIVLGLALIYVYLTLDFIPIYGTRWIIVVGFVTKYLPFSTRAMNAGFLQIHKELEEAAQIGGVALGKILLKIFVPLLLPSMVGVAIWIASVTMRELSMVLMLNSPNNTVLSFLIWNYWDQGKMPEASALGVLLILAVITLTCIGRIIGSRYSVR